MDTKTLKFHKDVFMRKERAMKQGIIWTKKPEPLMGGPGFKK
jgi:hypothetical protein